LKKKKRKADEFLSVNFEEMNPSSMDNNDDDSMVFSVASMTKVPRLSGGSSIS
jgi:hypothetical protein